MHNTKLLYACALRDRLSKVLVPHNALMLCDAFAPYLQASAFLIEDFVWSAPAHAICAMAQRNANLVFRRWPAESALTAECRACTCTVIIRLRKKAYH
eukprot:13840-Amphidinium_carterae.1